MTNLISTSGAAVRADESELRGALAEVRARVDRLDRQVAASPTGRDRRRVIAGELISIDGRLLELEEQVTASTLDPDLLDVIATERSCFEDVRRRARPLVDEAEPAPAPLSATQSERNPRAIAGTVITIVGALLVAFVFFQLLVTSIVADRSQRELAGEMDARLTTAAAVASGGSSMAGGAGLSGFGQLDPDHPEIPASEGETPSDVIAGLEALGLAVQVAPEVSRDLIPGLVVRTAPAEAEVVDKGSTVTVFVSTVAKGSPVAALGIPGIGVSQIVVEGTGSEQLMDGPGHYRDSPMPGQAGNAVILGKRSTYGGPFNQVGELIEGDTIEVATLQGSFTYKVVETKVVAEGEEDVLGQDDRNLLTLITSNPEYTATERLAVIAELEGEPVSGAVATGDVEEVGQAPVLSPDELGRDRDLTALGPALFWMELLTAALVLAVLLYRNWRRWPTWVITTPMIVAFAFLTFESIGRLLPSTLSAARKPSVSEPQSPTGSVRTSRWTLAAWLAGTLVVGLVGFVLLGRMGGSSAVERSATEPTTAVSEPTASDVDAVPGEQAAPEVATPEGASQETTGTLNGPEAPQSAYATYLGGDFDSNEPNTAGPLGVDENGCSLYYDGACLPPPPADVSCESIGQSNFTVNLGDPYNLDGEDQDGIACDDDVIVYGPDLPEPDPLD